MTTQMADVIASRTRRVGGCRPAPGLREPEAHHHPRAAIARLPRFSGQALATTYAIRRACVRDSRDDRGIYGSLWSDGKFVPVTGNEGETERAGPIQLDASAGRSR